MLSHLSIGPGRVLDRPLLTGKEVALHLKRDPGWFYRHREELRTKGFPEPIVGLLYDARAVDAWLDAQMNPLLRDLLEGKTP